MTETVGAGKAKMTREVEMTKTVGVGVGVAEVDEVLKVTLTEVWGIS